MEQPMRNEHGEALSPQKGSYVKTMLRIQEHRKSTSPQRAAVETWKRRELRHRNSDSEASSNSLRARSQRKKSVSVQRQRSSGSELAENALMTTLKSYQQTVDALSRQNKTLQLELARTRHLPDPVEITGARPSESSDTSPTVSDSSPMFSPTDSTASTHVRKPRHSDKRSGDDDVVLRRRSFLVRRSATDGAMLHVSQSGDMSPVLTAGSASPDFHVRQSPVRSNVSSVKLEPLPNAPALPEANEETRLPASRSPASLRHAASLRDCLGGARSCSPLVDRRSAPRLTGISRSRSVLGMAEPLPLSSSVDSGVLSSKLKELNITSELRSKLLRWEILFCDRVQLNERGTSSDRAERAMECFGEFCDIVAGCTNAHSQKTIDALKAEVRDQVFCSKNARLAPELSESDHTPYISLAHRLADERDEARRLTRRTEHRLQEGDRTIAEMKLEMRQQQMVSETYISTLKSQIKEMQAAMDDAVAKKDAALLDARRYRSQVSSLQRKLALATESEGGA